MELGREAIHFEINASGPGSVGEWIAAPPSAELPIRFSDGSILRLAPGGRARVATASAEGAEIALERGALELTVVHRDGARWMVVSGPVVGDLRRVRAGEELHVSIPKSTLEVGAAVPSDKESSASAPAKAPEVEAPAPAPSTPGSPPQEINAPSAPVPAPRVRQSWRNLARDARYKEALAAAEAEGFDDLCASASAADLQALADAARLGGGPARATQALSALRGRFPGSPASASAAFLLGRIAEDRRGDHADAIAWFRRYLAEAPRGELAEDARGRIVEATDKIYCPRYLRWWWRNGQWVLGDTDHRQPRRCLRLAQSVRHHRHVGAELRRRLRRRALRTGASDAAALARGRRPRVARRRSTRARWRSRASTRRISPSRLPAPDLPASMEFTRAPFARERLVVERPAALAAVPLSLPRARLSLRRCREIDVK